MNLKFIISFLMKNLICIEYLKSLRFLLYTNIVHLSFQDFL